ncbi:MAG: TGS domain-containing protein [Aigarchaeota archaeon]|nr:TGS domain-containing protein [Aigarchaeota archaeon]MCX8193105.1 TGS domain-containing protein [Nitrososphaeria archaeon]MDW7986728.1 TGS domain-containing protein [Nitrososphaerota archaeon]
MPTNLPAEAQKALAKYQVARTLQDKIKALEEALSLIPDHKGTEKLRAHIKRRIAELKREAERRSTSKSVRKDFFTISKEGEAQVVVIGAANSGKSSLLRMVTNAKPLVAPYQFSTDRPFPGMMLYEDVEIQLVELPAILTENLEETQFTNRSLGLVKNADGVIILLDGLNNPVQQLEKIVQLLDEAGISIKPRRGEIILEKKDSGGVRIVNFGSFTGTYKEIEEVLKNVGIRNVVVKIYGESSIEELEESIIRETVYKKALIVLNKIDAASPSEVNRVREVAGSLGVPFISISTERGEGLDILKREVFKSLQLIRVYTQKDGVVSHKPIVLNKDATVRDLAERIHKDLARKMKYARVWGKSVKLQGQQVGPDHILQDRDVVEIYSS